MEHSHEVLAELGGQGRQLRQLIPEVNGGPGTVWGPRALAAFDEFVAEAAEPPA